MKAFVDCRGCEQRELDAQFVLNYLKSSGIELYDSIEGCNYAILITCAVDEANTKRSIEIIKRASANKEENTRLIVGGCLPSIYPNMLSEYDIYATFSPRNINSLETIFNQEGQIDKIKYPNRSIFDEVGTITSSSPREKYEAAKNGFKIRINHGCLGSCSYCVIKNATGRLESIDSEVLIAQMRYGISNNEKTIMLMGGDTGAYGVDLKTGFYSLLDDMIGIPGDYQVFIHDFNVNWLIRDIKKYLNIFSSENGKRIRAINFPIQSGSDKILKNMKRPYSSRGIIRSLSSVRKVAPHIYLGTHVMIGFPGEDNEDLTKTIDILEAINFDFITCFPYSEHSISDSSKLEPKVSKDEVNKRLEYLSKKFEKRIKTLR